MNNLIIPMKKVILTVSSNRYNDITTTHLHFHPLLSRLQEIKIDQECFNYVHTFTVDGLESLKLIKIDNNCFKKRYDRQTSVGGYACIMNCPNLSQLTIHNKSFEYYKSLRLSNLNSLQSINLGCWCFNNGEELLLKGMEMTECPYHLDLPSLLSLHFEKGVFSKCQKSTFESIFKSLSL